MRQGDREAMKELMKTKENSSFLLPLQYMYCIISMHTSKYMPITKYGAKVFSPQA
jgi:hypothetical protein